MVFDYFCLIHCQKFSKWFCWNCIQSLCDLKSEYNNIHISIPFIIFIQLISRLYLFPVDERLVPLEHDGSNSGELIRLLPDGKFLSGHILRVPNELVNGDGLTAAKQFEGQLRELNPQLNANGFPIFDLLLLGNSLNNFI